MRNKFVVPSISVPFLARTYSFYSLERVMDSGRSITHAVMREDVVCERDKGVNPDDFALENLLTNGVDLKFMSLDDGLFVSHEKCLDLLSNIANQSNSNENESK